MYKQYYYNTATVILIRNSHRTKTVQVDIGDHIYIEANNGSVEEVLRELHSGGTNVTGKALADRHGVYQIIFHVQYSYLLVCDTETVTLIM